MATEFLFLANAGFCVRYPEGVIAVDAMYTDPEIPFSVVPASFRQELLQKEGIGENLSAFLVTHCHRDHCDVRLLPKMTATGVPVLLPEDDVFQKLASPKLRHDPQLRRFDGKESMFEGDGIRIRAFLTVHDRFHTMQNLCYLVHFLKDDVKLLILGDAETGMEYYPDWIREEKIDAVSVNFVELNQEKGRHFLAEDLHVSRLLLCHMPFPKDDRYHYRKYTLRQMERYRSLFPGLWLPEACGDRLRLDGEEE